MGVGSVVIRANPVLAWEDFGMSIDRKFIEKPTLEDRDIGGHWKATFDFTSSMITDGLVEDFLYNGGMRHVEIFNERGTQRWEGFIGKVEYDSGYGEEELNIMNVFNKQWARYVTGGTPAIDRTDAIENADSQDRIGIREKVWVGSEVSKAVANQAVAIADKWLSYPSPSTREIIVGSRKRGKKSLSVTAYGYYHALKARVYNQTILTGDGECSTMVGSIITDTGQFVNSTYIETNLTPFEQKIDVDREVGELIASFASFGDSGFHKWITGMRENREFYFMQAARPEF